MLLVGVWDYWAHKICGSPFKIKHQEFLNPFTIKLESKLKRILWQNCGVSTFTKTTTYWRKIWGKIEKNRKKKCHISYLFVWILRKYPTSGNEDIAVQYYLKAGGNRRHILKKVIRTHPQGSIFNPGPRKCAASLKFGHRCCNNP